MPSEATTAADPPKAPAPTGVSPSSGADDLAKGMEGVRSMLQRTGAALGAASAAVLAALGLTQAYELFPLPQGLDPEQKLSIVVSALAGAALALGGATWLAARFFSAQRRILLDSSGLQGDTVAERAEVMRVLTEHAREENARNLLALELRALRLDRIARRRKAAQLRSSVQSPPALASSGIQAEADRLHSVVSIALTRAAAVLLERRARDVFRGGRTAAALVMTLGGLLLLFGVGDYTDGERDLVELRKACSEAKPGAQACETVVPDNDEEAASIASEVEAQRKAKRARKFIERYQPTGTAAERAAQAAKLVRSCQTYVSWREPGLAGEELTIALRMCIAAAA